MIIRWTGTVLLALTLLGCAGQPTVRNNVSAVAESVSAETADPAVIYANRHRSGDIGYREGYFGTGDNRLHYVEAGKGPLVILYHGFPSFWYSWFDQMEMLKSQYHVVAVDGLGSGRSAKPQHLAPYRLPALAAQLDGLARHLAGEDKYILIGHDWGSVLALSYAQAYPERLHKVIGMSAPPANLFLQFLKSSPEQQQRSQYMQQMRGISLEQIKTQQMGKTIANQSYRGLAARGDLTAEEVALFHAALEKPETINAIMNWYRANIPPYGEITDADMWPSPAAKIEIPALFLWGRDDNIFVPELIDEISTAYPMLEFVELPDVHHWTSMQQPEKANAAITAFLKKGGT